MIARNFRKYPEALALQMTLELVCVVVRRIAARHTPSPVAKRIHKAFCAPTAREAEEIPVGAIVRTPTGKEARVLGYRGFRRDHRVRLWCEYLQPENKRFDKVLLVPELVIVLETPKERT